MIPLEEQERAGREEEEEPSCLAHLPQRRRARAVALQVLFEVDLTGHHPDSCLAWEFLQPPLPAEAEKLARTLVRGVLAHRPWLDEKIQAFAPAWPVGQLSAIDRNLLRLAIYELLLDRGTPPRAVVNEAVELAKVFGSDSSPRFVNGVLGSVMETADLH